MRLDDSSDCLELVTKLYGTVRLLRAGYFTVASRQLSLVEYVGRKLERLGYRPIYKVTGTYNGTKHCWLRYSNFIVDPAHSLVNCNVPILVNHRDNPSYVATEPLAALNL